MSDLLLLCYEFFLTGLFAVGGGLATIPFLTDMAKNYPHWFTLSELADMIAVSESTPGPIGVNMATYVGYTTAGVPGALLASFSLLLPSVAVVLMVASVFKRYREHSLVQNTFSFLRPAVAGLIGAAALELFSLALIPNGQWHFGAVAIFAVVVLLKLHPKTKKAHPIIYILGSAVLGAVLGL